MFAVCIGKMRIIVSSVLWWIERYMKCKCVRLSSTVTMFLVLTFYIEFIKLGDMCKAGTKLGDTCKVGTR